MRRGIEAVIHDVHMAEEPPILASAHDAEVHPVAVVLEHKSATGGEVTGHRNLVGYCRGAPERQQAQQHSTGQEREH